MSKIICIGSACKDMFFPTSQGTVTETPQDMLSQKKISFELGAKYKVEERYEALGGVAANVASGLARLGTGVACYSYIGDDYISQWTKEQLEKNGVEIDLITMLPGTAGDFSAIIVDKDSGERVIFTNQPANGKLEIVPEKLSGAEWFFLGDFHGDWEDHLEKVFAIAKENGIKIANNPRQVNIHENAKKVLEFVALSDILFINKDEALEILSAAEEKYSSSDLEDEKFLIEKIHALGPKVVGLTDGERGAWTSDGNNIFHAQILDVTARETTGAGDAFSSGFFAAYLKGKTLEECLRWGMANSCKSVEHYGSIEGLLDENSIAEIINEVRIKKVTD